MGLFDKFKEKIETSMVEATEKMDRSMGLQWAGNFKSGYESSNFDYMKTCLDELMQSSSLPFITNCAKGIYIISSNMDSGDLILLMQVSSNIKRLKNQDTDSMSDREKELREWYYQEFDRLVKMNNLYGALNWDSTGFRKL